MLGMSAAIFTLFIWTTSADAVVAALGRKLIDSLAYLATQWV